MTVSIFGPIPEIDPSWPEPLPARLSPSSMTLFLRCPEAWRRQYLLGERVRTSTALVIGRADSRAREVDLGGKILSGVNLSEPDIKIVAAEAFDQAVEDDGGVNEIDWENSKPGEAKDLTVDLAAAYRAQVGLTVVPTAVEDHLEAVFADVTPPIHGFLDVAEATRIREVKTSAKRRTKPLADWIIQTELYSAVTGLPAVFDISVKSRNPEVISYLSEPALQAHTDGKAAERLRLRAITVSQGILALLNQFGVDDYWPATGAGGMLPACGICDVKASCPFSVT